LSFLSSEGPSPAYFCRHLYSVASEMPILRQISSALVPNSCCLQVVTLGGDYDATSMDKTRNREIEVFDFTKLVQKFDAARTANAGNATGWAAMNSLLDAHLGGSDTRALGGDLAYQFASTGGLGSIGLSAAQSILAAGTDWQPRQQRA
jgi:hypothetical protein